MKSLCDSQDTANLDRKSVSLTALEQTEKRGVLYTGGVNHLMKIYESIYGMILLNISLPVEVWVNWEDQLFCKKIIGRLSSEYQRSDIQCKILPKTSPQSKSSHMGIAAQKSFMCKFTALLSTSFTDVIFVDADNLPITAKVGTIFDSDEYRATGAVIWPDIFGEKCRETTVRERVVDPGITAWRTHCAWQAKLGGLGWEETFLLAQEAETGQIALNLRRHGALIEFAKLLMEHDFFRTVFYGDKDLFRYVFLLMEEKFYFVPHYPGLSVYLPDPSSAQSLRVDSLIQYFPSSLSSSSSKGVNPLTARAPSEFEPYFFHQLKLRNPDAFLRALLVAADVHAHSSVCIQSSGCEIETLGNLQRSLAHRTEVDHDNNLIQSVLLDSTHTSRQMRNIRGQSSLLSSQESDIASSRFLSDTGVLEKLYLQKLDRGEAYARLAREVFKKGDADWAEINTAWFRLAMILHRVYGIFQAVYFQIVHR